MSARGCRLRADEPTLIPGVKGFRNSNGDVDLSMVTVAPRKPRRPSAREAATIAQNARLEAKRGRRRRARAVKSLDTAVKDLNALLDSLST